MDVAASAFGSGTVAPGDTSAVVGTTIQAQQLLDEPSISPPATGYLLTLGIEGMGLRAMGAITGTPNLDWAVEVLGADGNALNDPGANRAESADAPRDDGTAGDERSAAGGAVPYDAVEAAARSVLPGSAGVLYHPYLSAAGEKAPFVDPEARASVTGLQPDHTRAHLLRAVYEGVALALVDCESHLPGTVDRVIASGGGTRSAFWCRLFADCLGATVAVPSGTEFGAKGAAILAGVATGRYADVAEGVDRTTGVDRRYEPRSAHVAFYDRWYDVYRTTREAMAGAWSRRATVLDEVEPPDPEGDRAGEPRGSI
jgi:sugar (pentulose or hexulose) kinase